ncbi:MAG: hypothetical protein WA417_02945 [Stellaceae bacterium]
MGFGVWGCSVGRVASLAAPLLATALLQAGSAWGAESTGVLATLHRHVTRATTVPENGDLNPVIPGSAHVRLAAAASNDGAQILRRPYSYNDGVDFTAERWPPWRQGTEYDAGLFFVCYQRDARTGFVKIFEKMAKFDMLNQFATHTGGGLFACPGGIARGEFIGQRLFDAA